MMTNDYIGYLGSLLVATSLTMSNLKNLRAFNLVGASMMVLYGTVIQATPVILLNGFIVLVDSYYLVKMLYHKDFFTINDTLTGSEFFIEKFLSVEAAEIAYFFPDFTLRTIVNPHIILISRNLNPVGLFIYEVLAAGEARIHLDYARRNYRDLKNARFMFSKQVAEMKQSGVTFFSAYTQIPAHKKYLEKLGFEISPVQKNVYLKAL